MCIIVTVTQIQMEKREENYKNRISDYKEEWRGNPPQLNYSSTNR